MILRATVRDKHGDDFVRTIDLLAYKDYDKVAHAAAAWARSRVRAMGAYAPTTRAEMTLQLEWLEPTPANGARPQRLVAQEELELDPRTGAVLKRKVLAGRKGKHARKATSSRR
jgi:hypothetical protein